MRSIWLSLLIATLFTGCATKECGIDKEIFKNFSPQKQEEICTLYLKKESERQKLYEKRRLIEEQNKKLALENENLKLKMLYKKYERYGDVENILDISLRGDICRGSKKCYELYPVEFSIARGEAKKVCLSHRRGRGCFWMAYWEDSLFFNIKPNRQKRWMKRYLIEEPLRTDRHSVILPIDSVHTTTIDFEKDGRLYHLIVQIDRGCR